MMDSDDRTFCAGPHDWESAHVSGIHGLQRCRLCGILRLPDPRWIATPRTPSECPQCNAKVTLGENPPTRMAYRCECGYLMAIHNLTAPV